LAQTPRLVIGFLTRVSKVKLIKSIEVDSDNDGIPDEKDECPGEYGVKEYGGCPYITDVITEKVKEPLQKEIDFRVDIEKRFEVIARNITFESNKHIILPSSFSYLDSTAYLLILNPRIKLIVEGHTDNIGSNRKNEKLSLDRANSVVEYLTKKGVASRRLIAIGRGETQPITNNSNNNGKRLNRRVQFRLLEKVQSVN
jgi:outer membrane protein OmpA-like peptidoglycan-associated protein